MPNFLEFGQAGLDNPSIAPSIPVAASLLRFRPFYATGLMTIPKWFDNGFYLLQMFKMDSFEASRATE